MFNHKMEQNNELPDRLTALNEMQLVIGEINSDASHGPDQRRQYFMGYCQAGALATALVIIPMKIVGLDVFMPVLPFAFIATIMGATLIGRRKREAVSNLPTWRDHLSMLFDFYEPIDRGEWNRLLSARDSSGNIPLMQLSAFLQSEKNRLPHSLDVMRTAGQQQ